MNQCENATMIKCEKGAMNQCEKDLMLKGKNAKFIQALTTFIHSNIKPFKH